MAREMSKSLALLCEVVEQGRLADAGRAEQQHSVSVAGTRFAKQVGQAQALRSAPYKFSVCEHRVYSCRRGASCLRHLHSPTRNRRESKAIKGTRRSSCPGKQASARAPNAFETRAAPPPRARDIPGGIEASGPPASAPAVRCKEDASTCSTRRWPSAGRPRLNT